MKGKINGLYAIIDNTFSPQYSHVEMAEMFLLGGCRLMQLRMKPVSLRANSEAIPRTNLNNEDCRALRARNDLLMWNAEVFETAKKIMALKREFDFTFIINDYVDVAGEIHADGVHVGADDSSVRDVHKRIGEDILVGYSAHSFNEACAAEKRGADYIALGAIFPTKTKGPGHPVQGLQALRRVVESVSRPVVAIGGINRNNINDVLSCGVSAVAMITGLTKAPNIVEEVRWYVELLGHE